MKYVSAIEDKVSLIQERFAALVGKEVVGYELAQYWCAEDEEWSNWRDIPLFLSIGETTLSISWQKFDELAIEVDRALPFSLSGATVRLLCEDVESLDAVIGQKVASVSLGKGEMSIEEVEIDVWTRLLIKLSGGNTLEVFNALDENGIEVHTKPVVGEVQKCI